MLDLTKPLEYKRTDDTPWCPVTNSQVMHDSTKQIKAVLLTYTALDEDWYALVYPENFTFRLRNPPLPTIDVCGWLGIKEPGNSRVLTTTIEVNEYKDNGWKIYRLSPTTVTEVIDDL